jgi:hypothetical protein
LENANIAASLILAVWKGQPDLLGQDHWGLDPLRVTAVLSCPIPRAASFRKVIVLSWSLVFVTAGLDIPLKGDEHQIPEEFIAKIYSDYTR